MLLTVAVLLADRRREGRGHMCGDIAMTKLHRSALLYATLVVAPAPAVLAQDLSSDDYRGTATQRAACRFDVLRFCGPEIPNVRRITACLRANITRLSPSCAAVFDEQPRRD